MKKNFRGEARKARRVNAFLGYTSHWTKEELESNPSIKRKVERNPYVSRYWNHDYYQERQEREEASWKEAQKEVSPVCLEQQVEGISKAIRAKEIALKALLKDIKELEDKKEDMMFLLRNM